MYVTRDPEIKVKPNMAVMRKIKNMSMERLALKTGIGIASLWRYEYGITSPPVSKCIRIMQALDCDFDDLFHVVKGVKNDVSL